MDHAALAKQWLDERNVHGANDAWYRLQVLARTHPEDAWLIALHLVDLVGQRLVTAPSSDALRVHVASVPNEILEYHAAAFVDRMEKECVRPEFRALFTMMSLPDTAASGSIIARLKKASGGTLRIYPGAGTKFAQVAYEVADAFRNGELDAVPASTDFPVPLLAKEIERRLPGRTREEYEIAAAKGLESSR